jgi:hypothetical protein
VLLLEPQPVSDEAAATLRYWWGEDIYDNSALDAVLTGSARWDVLWHAGMMRASKCCEQRLVGVALSLYQSTLGDPAPFPSFAQIVNDTGLPAHSITRAVPDLIFKGLLVVPLPQPPAQCGTRESSRRKAPIPKELRWAVWERDDFTCQHCGARRNLSIDHIVPEALGGLTVIENLQTLCGPCNSAKGTRLVHVAPV